MNYFLLTIFAFWRINLFIIAWLGGTLFSFTPSFPYSDVLLLTSKLPSWIWSFANFDGVHYLTIAQQGYSAQFTQVFFPLYPLLIGIINNILPILNPVIIGLLLSNILFLLSLVIFWKLLQLDYKEKEIIWMIVFLLFFPTSFYFGSLYTESLFMFLVLSSCYAARIKRWWVAGILGGLASATRLAGILLLPALLWEYWDQNKLKNKNVPILVPSPRGSPVGHPRGGFKALLGKSEYLLSKYYLKTLHFALCALHSPVLYLVPLGLLFYMLYLQSNFGDWLYFWHVQPVFGAERSGTQIILLPQVIWRYLKILVTVPFYNYSFWVSVWELGSAVIGYWLLIIGGFRKVRSSYLIFAFLAITMPTLTGTFSSMPRYILVAFPMFIALGLIKSRSFKILLSVICYLLSGIFIILFTRGNWVS